MEGDSKNFHFFGEIDVNCTFIVAVLPSVGHR